LVSRTRPLTFHSHSQIKETAPTRRQSPAKARPAEPRIARSQSTHVRAECGFACWRRKSGSRKGGGPGQEWADEGHEGQEEEDDQGGQLLEGDGLGFCDCLIGLLERKGEDCFDIRFVLAEEEATLYDYIKWHGRRRAGLDHRSRPEGRVGRVLITHTKKRKNVYITLNITDEEVC
jgi:hypothetical protein